MPDDETFDALSAAAELDAALANETSGDPDTYIAERVAEGVARAEERLAREAGRDLARRTRAVLVDLIGVLDDLERALEAARRERDGSALLAGVELVARNFVAALARHGVTRVEALGEPFDPSIHDGVSMVPASDASQHGKVVAVLRAGYRIGDELLRPASVVIARSA